MKSKVVLICMLPLTSCWFPCAPAINGTVLNDSSGVPMDSVKIDFYEEGDFVRTAITDSTGFFAFSAESEAVFMTNECEREFQLTFSKSRYITQEFYDDAPRVGIVIRLTK